MDKHTYLNNAEPSSIEGLYQEYLKNSQNIDESWKKFFEGFEFARNNYHQDQSLVFDKEFRVINLIEGYRKRGHLFTETNPVRERRKYTPTLDIENFGLTDKDLDTV